MKHPLKALLLVTCLLLASFSLASAAVRPGAFTLSPMIGYQGFDSNLEIDDSTVFGLGLGYNLGSNWGLEFDIRYAPTETEFTGGFDVDVMTVTGNVLYHFQPEQIMVPYLVAGIGFLQYDIDGISSDDEDFLVNWGGGIKYGLTEQVDLRVDLRHTIDFHTDNRGASDGNDDISNNLSAMFGLNFQFGR